MANKKSPLSKAAQQRVKTYEVRSSLQDSKAGLKKRDNRVAVIAGFVALAIALGSQLGYSALHQTNSASASPTATPPVSTTTGKVPDKSLAQARSWQGSLKLNSGLVSFELDGKNAPQAVSNFISLVRSGFYNGVTCHRLTTSGIFVLQCGDPKGDGSGGPGYNFGPIENAPASNVYQTGMLAMARVGGNGSSMGSQFFIVYKDSPIPADAAGGYTVFGKITGGLGVVQAIAAVGTDGAGGDGKPKTPVTMSALNVK